MKTQSFLKLRFKFILPVLFCLCFIAQPLWAAKENAYKKEHKVAICHIPPGNPDNAHTIKIDESAVEAHLDHGDDLGKCGEGNEEDNDDNDDGTDDDEGDEAEEELAGCNSGNDEDGKGDGEENDDDNEDVGNVGDVQDVGDENDEENEDDDDDDRAEDVTDENEDDAEQDNDDDGAAEWDEEYAEEEDDSDYLSVGGSNPFHYDDYDHMKESESEDTSADILFASMKMTGGNCALVTTGTLFSGSGLSMLIVLFLSLPLFLRFLTPRS